jgi:malonate decarboxylase delta subunit
MIMEHLEYEFKSANGTITTRKKSSIVGVVASSNLEVMMESQQLDGKCVFVIDTAAGGFAASWEAVIADFMDRHHPADLRVSINDNAASPAVVSLRLDQAYETLTGE